MGRCRVWVGCHRPIFPPNPATALPGRVDPKGVRARPGTTPPSQGAQEGRLATLARRPAWAIHVVDRRAPLGTEVHGLAIAGPDRSDLQAVREVEALEATAVNPLWSVIRSVVPIVGLLVGRRVGQVDDGFPRKACDEIHDHLDVGARLARLGKEGLG